MRLKLKKRGQALVEFALFAVLLMMMISAVIDLGLVFLPTRACLEQRLKV